MESQLSARPELFNSWKIGHDGRNNGILILVSMDNPRKYLLDRLWNGRVCSRHNCWRIVQEDLIPYFKNKEYYNGLDKASTDLMQLLSGTFKGFPKKQRSRGIPPLVIVVLIIVAVILISRK